MHNKRHLDLILLHQLAQVSRWGLSPDGILHAIVVRGPFYFEETEEGEMTEMSWPIKAYTKRHENDITIFLMRIKNIRICTKTVST